MLPSAHLKQLMPFNNEIRDPKTFKALRVFLFKIARSPIGHFIVGWVFAYASFLLPVKRLYETKTIIAFHHPKPSYQPIHILIIPKKIIRSVNALTAVDGNTLIEIVQTANHIAQQINLKHYQLIVNAGAYQDVMQLHFHLIAR